MATEPMETLPPTLMVVFPTAHLQPFDRPVIEVIGWVGGDKGPKGRVGVRGFRGFRGYFQSGDPETDPTIENSAPGSSVLLSKRIRRHVWHSCRGALDGII